MLTRCVVSSAHDVAMSKQHKSISATDVLRALEILELGDLVEGLQTELQGTLYIYCTCASHSHSSVYRELSKTDKSKKGTSSIINPARAKPLAGSASAPVPSTSAPTIKLKLKDRPVGASVVSPYTSTPLAANDSISTGPMRMDVDGDTISQAEEEEIVEDDPSEEEEDLQDTVALEEEELKKDANALEDKSRHTLEIGEKMVVDNA